MKRLSDQQLVAVMQNWAEKLTDSQIENLTQLERFQAIAEAQAQACMVEAQKEHQQAVRKLFERLEKILPKHHHNEAIDGKPCTICEFEKLKRECCE